MHHTLMITNAHSKQIDAFPRHEALSYDIQASPTLSSKPPVKNVNMFEMAQARRLVHYFFLHYLCMSCFS